MTINYTTLLGLAKPVTGTETGQWGDVVNDEITSLLEDAVANAATFSVTVGDVTLSTTNGASNQARMSTLIITGSPGILRNVIVPSQAKIYVVINQANAEVVIKGAATTGVTVGAGQTAQIAWNGSDFVEIGNYVHGNFVVNGNLSVNGNSTLGDGGADTTTINGQFIGANSNISKATTVSTSAPALAWVKGATYTDTASAGGTTQSHAPFTLLSAPTLATSNIVTYTNASTFYIAGAPSASGSATITNPYAMYVAAGAAYLGGALTAASSVTLSGGTANGVLYLNGSKVATSGSALVFDGSNLGLGVTPSAWETSFGVKAFEISNGAVMGATNDFYILHNAILETGGWKYKTTDFATRYQQVDGAHRWFTAPSGTAGNAITFTQAMTLDASGNLGIGTSSPARKLDVRGSGNTLIRVQDSTGISGVEFITGAGTDSIYSGVGSVSNFVFYLAASEQMRLTSTGLGIGTSSPGQKLDVKGIVSFQATNSTNYWAVYTNTDNTFRWNYNGAGNDELTLDSSGNLGLGVTPSAWSGVRALQIGAQGSIASTGNLMYVKSNNYFDGANDRYIASNFATDYYQQSGQHIWRTAPSGTAGNAITFTQAMTLDASGNLMLGTTGTSYKLDVRGAGLFLLSGAGSTTPLTLRNDNTSSTQLVKLAFDGGGTIKASINAAVFGNDYMTFNVGSDTERARITSGGDLLVGTTATGAAGIGISNGANLTFTEGSGASYVNLFRQSNSAATVLANGYKYTSTANGFASSTGVSWAKSAVVLDTGSVIFYANGATTVANGTDVTPTERARITSGGDLLVGTTSAVASERFNVTGSVSGFVSRISNSNASPQGTTLFYSGAAPNGTGNEFLYCYDNAGGATLRASIRSNGGIANYSANNVALSDERLKTDIQLSGSYLDKICAIPVKTFLYKDQTDTERNLGVIAQDVDAVAPELIDHSGFGEAPEGESPYLSVYQTDLQYALMKCVQELKAQNDELRARVAALEAA